MEKNDNKEVIKFIEFYNRKLEYINEVYENEDSKIIIENLYKKYVMMFEDVKCKDVCYFTASEIADVVRGVPTTSYSLKSDVFSFINQYLNWAISKEYITLNPCATLDRDEIIKLNKRAIKEKLVGRDEFFARCEKLLLIEDNIFTILPLVLARFGITGNKYEYILNLKWEDCDRENKVVRIVNHKTGELITEIDIEDSRFFDWIDRAFNTTSYVVDIRNVPQNRFLVDYGYVLKKIEDYNKDGEKQENFNSIYQRLMLLFKLADKEKDGIPKMKMNDLVKSRRIELLLNIRENRKITTTDIKEMLGKLDPNASKGKYHNAMKTYESATGDIVLGGHSKPEQLVDENSKEFVANIREELGF
ncbi:MAG: hypothetical protein ACRDD7_05725 [Peptostreptococcaceae bacterium]